MENDYLVGLDGEKKNNKIGIKKLRLKPEKIYAFVARMLFVYLPILVFIYISYEENLTNTIKTTLPNLYLSLSFVFIAQVNNLAIKITSFANLLYAIKISGAIFSLVSFGVANEVTRNITTFFVFLGISIVTLFFSIENKNTEEAAMQYNRVNRECKNSEN